MTGYSETLEKALAIGKERHPDAPSQHHAAFANSVAYVVFRASGGYGGPSMREHWASRIIISAFGVGAGRCTFEQAVEALEECCFGPLTLEQALMKGIEYCFDDSDEDLARAEELLKTT